MVLHELPVDPPVPPASRPEPTQVLEYTFTVADSCNCEGLDHSMRSLDCHLMTTVHRFST